MTDRDVVDNYLSIRDRLVYICSRYRPSADTQEERKAELAANVRRATDACRIAAQIGYIPMASHLYAVNFLADDLPEEREIGLRIGMDWLALCSEMWVFGWNGPESVSEGMGNEILWAKEHGLTIRVFPEPQEFLLILNDEMEAHPGQKEQVLLKMMEGAASVDALGDEKGAEMGERKGESNEQEE